MNDRNKFSPKEFLKRRRPERFSDSVTIEETELERAVLEHQLSTLNKRSKELAFEAFSKKLCESLICPNLLEQTGPVAGGDGKTDTQTYPVSEQIKVLWYIGINDNANQDRWAFLISTQETWQAKCRSDVRKVHKTDRGYKKAFCITSQYAKSDQRAKIEDELHKETGIDVRILDSSWILDEIYKNGLEKLAIDELSIDTKWRREIKVGANDYAKGQRINEIENTLKNNVDITNITAQQADLFLEQAVLTKELDRPRIESQGLYERAIKIAENFGSSHKLFDAHYQLAWAAYWWYEDIEVFEENFLKCLKLAKPIGMSNYWGDVTTLLGVYTTYSRFEEVTDLDIPSLRKEITEELELLIQQDYRPSNSIMAQAHVEIIKLLSMCSWEEASDAFKELLNIAKQGERLVGFSFSEIYELASELDFAFGDDEHYESLIDYLTTQSANRNGDIESSRLLLKRGARRLESKKPYQAIKLIGKSLIGLYKKEAKKDLYYALHMLSTAYSFAGLYWASRSNLLLAASLVTDELWQKGEILPTQIQSYIELAKVELLLGRLNYALEWWSLACSIDARIEENIISENDFKGFDAFLAQCFLNTNLNKLSAFQKLPDYLDRYQLFVSRSMLLHALGHEAIVEQEYELSIDDDYLAYLKMLRDTDLGAVTPEISILIDRYSQLQSVVMGCEIIISFPFRSPIVELAETVLAAIESLFSTALVDRIAIIEPKLVIEITADDEDEINIHHEKDDSGSVLKFYVFCSSFTQDKLNQNGQRVIQEWLSTFIIEIFANVLCPEDPKGTLESMIGEDRALERAVIFGACFIGQKNIMGDDYVSSVKNFLNNAHFEDYELVRSEPWDTSIPKEFEPRNELGKYKAGSGEVPDEIKDNESVSHRDLKIAGLIKTRLWDSTTWKGIGFARYPNGDIEMNLIFEHERAGTAIIQSLHEEVGDEDTFNRLRVSIIKGIDKDHPHHYRVCITENVDFSTSQRAQMICRLNTMEPNNSSNMDMFLEIYAERGSFTLGHGFLIDGELTFPKGDRKTIRKSQLIVLNAWEVEQHSVESLAIKKKLYNAHP